VKNALVYYAVVSMASYELHTVSLPLITNIILVWRLPTMAKHTSLIPYCSAAKGSQP
jgi:hypothetical protein